ncbi:hypothetical protein J3R30DRAFT_3469054 [Lentinula aciculospora]|uniref:Uncharacterized protein n=1 Tax=Lentinula aciculospora TaxID=153920 RepID=A0A9W9AEH7_9AGAR|nr:hypothetical protein J3R30DRAFT_3469054 [Lentinula aciculospora]
MSRFVKLSEEVVASIISNLSRDEKSLSNLCLVGNRIVLAIARSYLCKEANVHVNFDDQSDPYSLSVFVTDELHARSVVSVKFIFSGIFDNEKSNTSVLQKSLQKLTSLKHAHLSFFRMREKSRDSNAPILLEILLQSLPNLTSIYVEGYDPARNLTTPIKLHQLKALVVRYSNPILSHIWTSAPGLEVIEMLGGSSSGYYVTIDAENLYTGYTGSMVGTKYVFEDSGTLVKTGYFDHLKRLYVGSDLSGNLHDDVEAIIHFFRRFPNSLPFLEELVLFFHFSVEDYTTILRAVAGPQLKRLRLGLSPFLTQIADRNSIFHYSSPQWDKCTSLKELWLPIAGPESLKEIGLLQPAMNILTHLYFEHPFRDRDEFVKNQEELVKLLSSCAPLLEIVSWDNGDVFGIIREDSEVKLVSKQTYVKPKWQRFASSVKWWDS